MPHVTQTYGPTITGFKNLPQNVGFQCLHLQRPFCKVIIKTPELHQWHWNYPAWIHKLSGLIQILYLWIFVFSSTVHTVWQNYHATAQLFVMYTCLKLSCRKMTRVITQSTDEKATLWLQSLAKNKQPWAGHLNPVFCRIQWALNSGAKVLSTIN